MVSLFMKNIRIILVILMVCITINKLSNKISMTIKIKWKGSIIARNNLILHFLEIAVIYSVLACMVTLQQMYNFISFDNNENYMSLTIGIFTLYGIFYVFIQFAISYALQNDSDKFWGKSKTKNLLTQNIEYKFFNSNTFKLLLLISATFSILKREIVISLGLPRAYMNFSMALRDVSILIIYVLYILLFIKSLVIMEKFFSIQEKSDFWVKYKMKSSILEQYKIIFYESYKKRKNYFFRSLIDKIKDLNSQEKVDMLLSVLSYSCDDLINIQQNRIKKIKKGKKIRKRDKDDFRYRISYLKNMFRDIWKYIEEQKIKVNFKDVLNIYKIQDSILFNQIYIYCLGNQEKITKELISVYNDDRHYLYSFRSKYFEIPKVIYDKISNYSQLVELNDYITDRKATKKLFHKYMSDIKNESNKLADDEQVLINGHEKYIHNILDKYKLFQSQYKKDDLLQLFGSYNFNKREIVINHIIQEQIYLYILKQEYSCLNKQYVKVLFEILDYKYILTFIFYRMFYNGSYSYSKWKDDILFLREINYDYYGDKEINSDSNIQFVCETIMESCRISSNLIKWIINNSSSNLTEDILQKCIDDQYMSYAKFLKLKYIFAEIDYFHTTLSRIEINNLKQPEWCEWRLDYLSEMLRTPNLLNKKYFLSHHFWFCREVLQPMFPKYLYEIQDFRMLYINLTFSLSEEQFSYLIMDSDFICKGILEFLILKIEDEYYNYLLSNQELSKVFKSRIKVIIDRNNTSIECYIDNLVEKANECIENSISIIKKEQIISKLKKLLS